MEEVQKEILLKAGEMFMMYGIRSITMDELASKLGMSKKTIYQYFKNKDELVEAFANMYKDAQEAMMAENMQKSEDVIAELLLMSDHMKEKLCKINPAFMYDVKKYYPKAWNVFLEFKKGAVCQQMKETLRNGVEQGYFRKELDIDIITAARIEQIEMAFNPEVFPPTVFDSGKVHLQLFENFMYGICTLKGHKLINERRHIIED